ncbi:DNA-binding transcriptional regulator, HxlR family [Halomicrobium zhouii]|uniref:DNA-binding transcriptional regulator, HxlR family n=1 Tax=Halomicrobium zhouii TaxID=767519 RepID=A0A1I6M6M1_9EURY|nr:winged helix-turn-helix domain-containing protein [Halomicrobium zhouii]SFS11370.1 DNA-binding transcriptional regulator, HxlR family [Halomicrobium zhouii]
MTDSDDTEADVPPEQAFAVLGDETRVDIVRALAEAQPDALGFSELRARVGVRDSAGFNYHLQKLLDRFVRKGEDGYELTTAGAQVYGAILSGAYTASLSVDPVPLSADRDVCPSCGAGLEARYEDERMTVGCVDCDRVVAGCALPPAAVEGRPREEIPAAFGRYLDATLRKSMAGFCTLCSGPTTGRLERGSVPSFDVDDFPLAVFRCERCQNSLQASPGAVLLTHPAVIAFYRDHSVDLRDQPPWHLPFLRREATTVLAEDPLRVRVDVEHGGETLAVTLDEDLSVVDAVRED